MRYRRGWWKLADSTDTAAFGVYATVCRRYTRVALQTRRLPYCSVMRTEMPQDVLCSGGRLHGSHPDPWQLVRLIAPVDFVCTRATQPRRALHRRNNVIMDGNRAEFIASKLIRTV